MEAGNTGYLPMHRTKAAVVNDALAERDRQDEQWGVQNHHPAYWLAILGKQVGQLGTSILNREWWTDKSAAVAEMRHEAIQVIAVAMALVECIDRGNMPDTLVTAQPQDPRQRAKALGHGDEVIRYDDDDEEEDL